MKAFNPRVAARWVRRRFRHNICKVASNLAPSSFARACDQQHCLHQWQFHFQHAADVNADDFCRARFARVRRRVQRIRASRTCSQNVPGPPFAVEELHAALRQCEFGKTPGCDNIPYEALAVKSCWWQTAILNFLELCRISSCVPSIWKHGIVVPLAKSANSTDRNDYRPITLTCCFAKLLERLILNRVRPTIDPRLDECQAGFRYGSDVQVYALLDTLRLRQDVPIYCAFLDIRKAFDVAWRDGAMLRLHKAGVSHDLWHLIDDLTSDRSAAVRLDSQFSDTWDVEDGVGQGAVLSGFLFNILINGLATAIKRACNGVSCGLLGENVAVKLLLYADDIVVFSDNPADLQRALDAAHAWASSWRFHFGVGPKKSAVMVLGHGRVRTRAPAFSFRWSGFAPC